MSKHCIGKQYEEQVLHAINAQPKNVDMWVNSVGNPNKNHKNLIEMYNLFCDICDKHDVKAWLLFGSIIGYVRHGGIIPWEWDMDVGVSTHDYNVLLKLQHDFKHPDWEFCFYSDPPTENYKGYPGETYCFKSKTTTVLVDICEYKEIEDLLVPQVPDGYEQGDYESYPISEMYPLRRTTILGYGTWLPKNPQVVLKWYGDITWYDPVPFILTRLFNPTKCELFCTPATKEIPEVKSITEGMELYGNRGSSFVVRGLTGIDFDIESVDVKLNGWYDNGLPVEGLSSKEMVKMWKDGKLKCNFVDSPSPNVTSISSSELSKYVEPENLMIILSGKDQYTPFHIDAVCDWGSGLCNKGGGGWMYLSKGQKLWHIMHPKHLHHLYNRATGKFDDLSMSDLLYHKDNVLWGCVETTFIEEGDFIYLASGYLHRVKTYKNSYGLGGYIDCDKNTPNREFALSCLKHIGVDVEKFPGIWI